MEIKTNNSEEQSKETDYKELYEQTQKELSQSKIEIKEVVNERTHYKEKYNEAKEFKSKFEENQKTLLDKELENKFGKNNIEKANQYKEKGLSDEEIKKLLLVNDHTDFIDPSPKQQQETNTQKQYAYVPNPITGQVEYKEITGE